MCRFYNVDIAHMLLVIGGDADGTDKPNLYFAGDDRGQDKPAPGSRRQCLSNFRHPQLANKSFCIPMNFEPIDMKVNHVRAEIVHEFPFTPFDAVLAAVLVCPTVTDLPFGLPGTRIV